jgi:leader peptidase (prepilin peptidase)/N-methyltransferase
MGESCAHLRASRHMDIVTAPGGVANAVLAGPLLVLLAVVTITDLRTRTIPDRAVVPASVGAIGVSALLDPASLPERLAAGACAGGFLLAGALVRPGGMGLGDAKLAAALGLYLGRAVIPALAVSLVAGAAAGAVLLARHGWAARRRTIPFGPFLAAGALVTVWVR